MLRKSTFILPFAKYKKRQIDKWKKSAIEDQDKILNQLISRAKKTAFGVDHDFNNITDHKSFQSRVPIRDYEGLRSYVDRIVSGESDILWPGKPKYFAKTSGTTSGVKYIPLTKDSMPNHMNSARDAMLNYMAEINDASIFDGKLIFLSGSPELGDKNGIATGRLSGIVNHEIPAWIKGNQVPSWETNCIEDWEEKVSRVVEETSKLDLRLIGGIPPWVQMYFEKLIQENKKDHVIDIFKNFSVFMYGGVNYEPYRSTIEKLIGRRIDAIELFPASEGFFAFQDSQKEKGLLLNTKSGIFFEFVPLTEIFDESPRRLGLREVEIGVDYALIINNNAGLWGYNIGDTVQFVSKDPYRVIVSGRIKHYISAFGEHVIGKEVESALLETSSKHNSSIVEFTVAPQVNPESGLPYHEWFVEFSQEPADMNVFTQDLDRAIANQNIYYQDLIEGGILRQAMVRRLKPDSFRAYMMSQGKLGGQNKVPRLSNDRKIASFLEEYITS